MLDVNAIKNWLSVNPQSCTMHTVDKLQNSATMINIHGANLEIDCLYVRRKRRIFVVGAIYCGRCF